MEVIIFSDSEFISVKVPSGLDGQEYFYAIQYTNLKKMGYSEMKASIIAEAAAMKRLYPGLVYGKVLEDEITGKGIKSQIRNL